MTSRPIRFLHRGATVEVADIAPTRTVLDWLREDAGCTGTKEGCNEGDCGACTVVVGGLAGTAGSDSSAALELQAVNACIQFLPMLDGKALFTVEDLEGIASALPEAHAADRPAAKSRPLHPVQRAMVECHGSQCGFCTPGFVMSLWSIYEAALARGGERPSRQHLADDLSGNLCRCTGYRPILDAGRRMFDLPEARLDAGPVVAALQRLRADPPLAYAASALRFEAPQSVDALAAARLERPTATLLAGATDIGVWVTKRLRELPDVIHLGRVDELKRIERSDDGSMLRIGAGASLQSAFAALVREWPSLDEVGLRFASVPIRNAGTLGGNIANGSPIGDGAPLLMAVDAELELRRGAVVRRLPLADFYTGYMKNRLEPGEFVQAIVVPLGSSAQVRAYKMSKRFDSDISAVCAALAIELEGDLVRAARFAFGGMAATVRRATRAEAAVVGRRWDAAALVEAQRELATEFQPLDDLRASAWYRTRVSQNLLRRFWLETRFVDALGPEQVSVWHVPGPAGHGARAAAGGAP